MDPVSVLVFNALAKRQGINLPGVGALHVVTSAARTEERNTLVPPVNRVELLPDAQPGFLDVIDLLARYGETDRDDAQQTYNSWLAQVSSEEGVTIDSVGLVSEGTFRPAPQMAVVLNPAGTAPMRLPRKGSGNGLLWWVVLAVVVGAGIPESVILSIELRRQNRTAHKVATFSALLQIFVLFSAEKERENYLQGGCRCRKPAEKFFASFLYQILLDASCRLAVRALFRGRMACDNH